MEFFWTYEYDGEIFDHEFKLKSMADISANVWYANYCVNNLEPSNGDCFSDEMHLISYYYGDDGSNIIDEREKIVVEYEYYHGDHAEHFNQGDYI